MGPTAGRISNRCASGNALLAGRIVLGGALVLIWLPSILAVMPGPLAICVGFFRVHAAAAGSLNCRLSSGQGQANALYVWFYYVGGWVGITGSGFAYTHGGWSAVISSCARLLLIPLSVGIAERGTNRSPTSVA